MGMIISFVGTHTPPHFFKTEDSHEIAEKYFKGSDSEKRLLPALYRRSRVSRRHSVVLREPEGLLADRQTFYPRVDECCAGPSTADRMRLYEQSASDLAIHACQLAFERSAADTDSVTHLVTVSCSGFSAPGFDIDLAQALQLPTGVERTHIGFMGCHGALNGLRVANAFVGADARATVLLCAVELCSLHYQYSGGPEQVVANALFADGAAALLATSPFRSHINNPGWSLEANASHIVPGTKELMTWRVGDHGFEMTLSPTLPSVIKEQIRPWLRHWLAGHGLDIEQVSSWAVHPGGPRILAAFEEAMSFRRERLQVSYDILREYGNMSSPTILFILNRLMEEASNLPCVAIGFGPGLTIEAALLTAVSM